MKFAMDYHVVPVLSATSASTVANSAFVDMGKYPFVDFLVQHMQGEAAALTVVECPASSTTGSTIDTIRFVYRECAAVGGDSIGAASSGDTTYAGSTVDGLTVISVDARDLGEGYKYARVNVAAVASKNTHSIIAVCHPRYAQEAALSST
jgi:hypothetical protein